jgi:hypothetical protein
VTNQAGAVNWGWIKWAAQPGDVLLLRREFPTAQRQCVLELIHDLDGLYDHAALVMPLDSQGNTMIAHATKDDPTVDTIVLEDLKGFHDCVRAELRRHSSVHGERNPNAGEIVCNADSRRWPNVHYAYGDLLLAGLAATSPRADTPAEQVRKVLRARVLALCIVVLNDELTDHTAAVTCASFVNACHDGPNALAGPFPTIDQRLKELASGVVGGVDWIEAAMDLLQLYRHRLDETPVYDLMNEYLCPDSVTDGEAPDRDLLTFLSLNFLRILEKRHMRTCAGPQTSGTPAVSDANRLLLTLEDLRKDPNLVTIGIEPHT